MKKFLETGHPATFADMTSTILKRPIFSGHDSFQCRHLWLKKGYDFVKSGKSFAADEAVVHLGVGKNMVTAVRHWMRAFDLLDEKDQLTPFADWIFEDKIGDKLRGFDPFLEDDASLWLLHWKLVTKGYATSFSLIFNDFRRQRVEFGKDHFSRYVKNLAENPENRFVFNPNTIGSDFEVFAKLYVGDEKSKDAEDIVSGVLTELTMVNSIHRDGNTVYHIPETPKDNIPLEILLFALLDDPRIGLSINLHFLETEPDSLRSVFAITPTGLLQKIRDLAGKYPNLLVFKEDAGVRELQFKEKLPVFEALKLYYHAS